MSLIGCEYFIEVGGIAGHREVLGKSIKIVRGDIRLRLDLPSASDSFQFSYLGATRVGKARLDQDAYESQPVAILDDGEGDIVTIRLVRIVANTESWISASRFSKSDQAHSDEYSRLNSVLYGAVMRLSRDFSEWMRVDVGQYWNEPAGYYPRVANLFGLVDITAGRSFGMMMGRAGSVRVMPDGILLDVPSLQRVGVRLQEEGSPQAWQVLLTEAKYTVESELVAGPDRATLLAAIALEIGIKAALRRRASDAQQSVVELLLANPREWSMSVHGLFNKALVAVNPAGHDMDSHRILSKRVQVLFTARNAIVHSGISLSRAEAKEYVETADLVFAYLQQLEERVDDADEGVRR